MTAWVNLFLGGYQASEQVTTTLPSFLELGPELKQLCFPPPLVQP